jgi:hypothetical protein
MRSPSTALFFRPARELRRDFRHRSIEALRVAPLGRAVLRRRSASLLCAVHLLKEVTHLAMNLISCEEAVTAKRSKSGVNVTVAMHCSIAAKASSGKNGLIRTCQPMTILPRPVMPTQALLWDASPCR